MRQHAGTRRRRWLAVAAAGLTAALAGCQTVQTTSGGAVGVERQQQMLSIISEDQVRAAAASAYQEQLSAAAQRHSLNTDPKAVSRVRGIAQRLIAQTVTFRPDAVSWPWEVNVEQADELNAFAMPGGKVMVYTGLMNKLALGDAELAAVIGHEIAHALRDHGRERMSRAYGQQLAIGVGAAALGVGGNMAGLASDVATVAFQLPFSREQEREADRIGLELMARAGYDPKAAITVWEKMSAQNAARPVEFLSTHPSDQSRMADLRSLLPKVQPLYQAAAGH